VTPETESGSLLGSVSFARTGTDKAMSSAVVAVSSIADGASADRSGRTAALTLMTPQPK
jgi:hypothetical protein